jgi:hypothetical protein
LHTRAVLPPRSSSHASSPPSSPPARRPLPHRTQDGIFPPSGGWIYSGASRYALVEDGWIYKTEEAIGLGGSCRCRRRQEATANGTKYASSPS